MKIPDFVPEVDSACLNELAKDEKSKMLFTAVEYDVFSLLKRPRHAEEVCGEIKTDPKLTEKFLNVLAALGLIRKIGDKYLNTKLSETFLVKENPFYQGNRFRMKMRRAGDWLNIKDGLKGNNKKTDNSPEQYIDEVFIKGHEEAAICGPLQKAVHMVSTLPEFKKAKKILDLGGGHGLYALAFAQIDPDMEVVLFDLPHVTEMARKNIMRYNMEERIKIISGDFNRTDIGDGYDMVFASDVTIEGVLGKIYNSLNEKGAFVYRRWTLNDDRISPLTSVLFDFSLAMANRDHCVHTLNEYVMMLESSGFIVSRVIDIATEQDPTKIIVAKREENTKWI